MSTLDKYGIQYGTGDLVPKDNAGGVTDPTAVTQRRARGSNGSFVTGGSTAGAEDPTANIGQDLLNAISMGNLGTGQGVYSRRESNTFYFKSLDVEDGLTIRTAGDKIIIGGNVESSPGGGDFSGVNTSNSSTINLSGLGTTASALGAAVRISTDSGNALVAHSNGLYVPVSSGGATSLVTLSDVTLAPGAGDNNKPIVWNSSTNKWVLGTVGGGSGATAFLGLSDTPSSYSGQGGKVLAVNSGATGLEFINKIDTLVELTDLPSITGQAGKVLAVNGAANGFQWITPASGGGGGGLTVHTFRVDFAGSGGNFVGTISAISSGLASVVASGTNNATITVTFNSASAIQNVISYGWFVDGATSTTYYQRRQMDTSMRMATIGGTSFTLNTLSANTFGATASQHAIVEITTR